MLEKNYVSIIIVIILFSSMNSTAYTDQQESITDDEHINNYSDLLMGDKQNEDFPLCRTMEPQPLVYADHLKKPSKSMVPTSFSWKDHDGDWTTPARYQGNCGSCWAFAAVGIIETMINIRENNPGLDPDLSEQYVLSCLSNAGSCNGGSPYEALNLILSTKKYGNYCNGIPVESCMPYQADDAIACSDKQSDWMQYLVPLANVSLWSSDGSETDRERMKTQIYQSGPVIAGFYVDDAFSDWGLTHHNPDEYYPWTTNVLWSNHVVMIVGWHDDDTIEGGGYWICKNSWSSFWGYEGFFNLEYGAQGIDHGFIIGADYDKGQFDWPPIVQANDPVFTLVNESVLFSAEYSIDGDDDQINVSWEFGDGSTAFGTTVEHFYEKKGIYPVKVIVTDSTGKTGGDYTAAVVSPWKKGNTWTYDLSELSIMLNHDLGDVLFSAACPSLEIEVKKETSDFYELSISGPITADALFKMDWFDNSVQLSRTSISGSIMVVKSDMSIQNFSVSIHGRLKVNDFFIFPFSFPFHIDIIGEFDDGFDLFDMPLYDDKTYEVTSSILTVDGKVSSSMFDIMLFIDTIAGLFDKNFLSEELRSLLPDINLERMFDTYFGRNMFYLPSLPDLTVKNSTNSVAAGSFQVFQINYPSLGQFSFAPSVQNLISLDLSPAAVSIPGGSFQLQLHAELLSTNYQ